MTGLYLFFFAIMPLALSWLADGGKVPPSLWHLLAFQVYGAFWAGWAAMSTRIANRSIMDVAQDVIPSLSGPVLDRISRRLSRRYWPRWRLLLISWAIGAAAASLAGVLLHNQLPGTAAPPAWQIVWWCVGWTILYTTSAKVVNVGRFHQIFAQSLSQDQALFWPNAAKSHVLASIALIAKRMLLFWLAVAISIALILPFALLADWIASGMPPGGPGATRIPLLSFTVWHLAGTAIFSIGGGSLVFLGTEAALRRAARREAAAALQIIEDEAEGLDKRGELAASDIERLAELRSLHADVAEGGSYRTFVLSGLSLIIPFVPLLTLLLKGWLDRK